MAKLRPSFTVDAAGRRQRKVVLHRTVVSVTLSAQCLDMVADLKRAYGAPSPSAVVETAIREKWLAEREKIKALNAPRR